MIFQLHLFSTALNIICVDWDLNTSHFCRFHKINDPVEKNSIIAHELLMNDKLGYVSCIIISIIIIGDSGSSGVSDSMNVNLF